MLKSYYAKTRRTLLSTGKLNKIFIKNEISLRFVSDNNDGEGPELINSTILLENGYNVAELPVAIKKIKDLSELETFKTNSYNSTDSTSYNLIREEFQQCLDLRDVFTLLTKCTKITPNIALGAIERIYNLEKINLPIEIKNEHVHFAKGAVLEKLLKVVLKTEETQTIISILKSNSSIIQPYKNKFCDELLLRVIDNKLDINQLCEFANFLQGNYKENQYADVLDKLWIGFTAKEADINESNIEGIFSIISSLKISKKTMTVFIEQKLGELWPKININSMQNIMEIVALEKYFSLHTFSTLSNWFYGNVQAFNDDTMLDFVSKFTKLNYTDDQVEATVEKYMRLKGAKVKSYVLIVGILNYCLQFQIRNEVILQACCDYYMCHMSHIPPGFIKSFIYPFGFLYLPSVSQDLWHKSEKILCDNYKKVNIDDLCSIIMSFIYVRKYPTQLVYKVFHSLNLKNPHNINLLQKLYLIDTAMTIECKDYSGPLLPKDQGIKPIEQEQRKVLLINKVKNAVADMFGAGRVSTSVMIPNYCSDNNFLIDIMLHAVGSGSETFNWKLKSHENIALLIHLPDHYCSKSDQLIGPQMMKVRHLGLLGFKVVSLKHSEMSHLCFSNKNEELKKYLKSALAKI